MVDLSLTVGDFPSLDGRQQVTWAPVFLSPIAGSPERLVVAIAVAGKQDGVVCTASAIERLRCLYGQSADFIIASTNEAIKELAEQVSRNGESLLSGESFSVGPIHLGPSMRSTAKEMRALADFWLSSISSLQDTNSHFVLKSTSILRLRQPRQRGDRLPSEVLKAAAERKSPILNFFTKSTRRSASKAPLANVALDFSGRRIVANFGKLRPMSNMRAEFDRIRGRLWALDVNQVRAGHFENDAVQYELLLEQPKLSDFGDGGKKVAAALDELAQQADEKNLGFRQFDSVMEILNHLEKREAA